MGRGREGDFEIVTKSHGIIVQGENQVKVQVQVCGTDKFVTNRTYLCNMEEWNCLYVLVVIIILILSWCLFFQIQYFSLAFLAAPMP